MGLGLFLLICVARVTFFEILNGYSMDIDIYQLLLVSSGPPLLSEINITIHLCYQTKILIPDVGGVARVSTQRISDGYQLLSSGPLLSEKTLSLCNSNSVGPCCMSSILTEI
jgi:hypothetical protein